MVVVGYGYGLVPSGCRIRRRLLTNIREVAKKGASISIDVEDFALVTHRVPASRVRRHLPSEYELQTHVSDRVEYCFVSATCFMNRDFRPTAVGFPRHSFYETTYRAYITYRGDPAVYFFARYLGTPISFVPQRAMSRDAFLADFDVTMRRNEGGYSSYVCVAKSAAGSTSFSIGATATPRAKAPWKTVRDYTQFITYRPLGGYKTSIGSQGQAHVEHAPLHPVEGILHSGRFDLWERLGIVPRDEADNPYSVLIAKGTRFLLYPPIPVLSSSA